MNKTETYKQFLFASGGIFLSVAAVFTLITGISLAQQRNTTNSAQNTITVTGNAEVNTKPDIAVISYTLRGEGKTSLEAETAIKSDIEKLSYDLKKAGIKEDDIKTIAHTVNPKYEYLQPKCTQYNCPQGESKLVGYEVFHNETIKVRDLAKSSDFMGIITAAKVYSVNGPDMKIEDPIKQKTEAREKAIAQARESAKKLAKSLDVKLGSMVSFSENGDTGGYPQPMYFAKAEMAAMDSAGNSPASAAINIGTETTTATVTLVYRIK